MKISVLIACRDEPTNPTLGWVLEGFAAQQLDAGDELDILVGFDGHMVGITAEWGNGVPIHILGLPRIGAAAVRNELAGLSRADVLLFGNADARPQPGMVAAHLRRQRELPPNRIVLGNAPWEKGAAPTVFDALLAETAAVFFYNQMRAGECYDWRHAWTLNLSMRREDFQHVGGFDEQLRPVYYEDVELAWRVLGGEAKGVFYEPAAAVIHRHPTTLEQYLDREELLGLMAPVLGRVNPAAFAALLGGKTPEELAREFAGWVKVDAGMHRWIYQRLQAWATLDAASLGEGVQRTRVLETIYQMHVPLKRLAFRVGFLRGMDLAADLHWQERRPTGLWRAAMV